MSNFWFDFHSLFLQYIHCFLMQWFANFLFVSHHGWLVIFYFVEARRKQKFQILFRFGGSSPGWTLSQILYREEVGFPNVSKCNLNTRFYKDSCNASCLATIAMIVFSWKLCLFDVLDVCYDLVPELQLLLPAPLNCSSQRSPLALMTSPKYIVAPSPSWPANEPNWWPQ